MLALTQAMIHSWELDQASYLNFAEQELLDLLIDAGFIFAYEAVACQLRLHGRAPSARQDSVAQSIAHSALPLLTELLAENSGREPRSQTRIFGLLATMANSRVDLPADLARDIPFSREAIDCITTAAFSYRAHYTLAELSKVLDRSDIHTPTLRSLLHYVKTFKSPLQHRFEEISGSRPAVICIDQRMEQALNLGHTIASLIQDGRSSEAEEELAEALAKFPSLLEFQWWRHQLNHTEQNAPLELGLDASLGCDTQESSQSVELWHAALPPQLEHSFLVSCVHRLNRPLDHDARSGLMRCCQILAWRFNAEDELERLRLARETQQTIGADFDPFFLTLLKAGISNYWQHNTTSQPLTAAENITPTAPKLIVLTGLPSPILSATTTIRHALRQSGNHEILVADMQAVDRAMLDSAYMQTGIYSYPEVVAKLEPEHISSARQFYLQNLSFNDPIGQCSMVLHVNQEAFRHLALLARLFPSVVVVEILPDLNQWISQCLQNLGGYNCEFAIPSEPELIAYANDYIEIMALWRNHLNIAIHTIQNGRWLGSAPSAETLPAALVDSLLQLDNRYNTSIIPADAGATPNNWGAGEDGKQLRAIVDAYMAIC